MSKFSPAKLPRNNWKENVLLMGILNYLQKKNNYTVDYAMQIICMDK